MQLNMNIKLQKTAQCSMELSVSLGMKEYLLDGVNNKK